MNGILQRARARLEQAAPAEDEIREPASPDDRDLADRYAEALEKADITALTELLREDAVFEMPPRLTWFVGRAAIGAFLQARVLREPGVFRVTPTAANGQPALASYLHAGDGVYRAYAIQVLSVAESRVTRITSFIDPGLFATFGLPSTLPAGAPAPGP